VTTRGTRHFTFRLDPDLRDRAHEGARSAGWPDLSAALRAFVEQLAAGPEAAAVLRVALDDAASRAR
jgi:hypothetical protein